MIYPFAMGRSACILLFILTLLGGCAGTDNNTRFYALNSMGIQHDLQRPDATREISIEVGPVEIPDYLDRPHIVTRSGENEFAIDYFNLWAGSLKDNIARVLAENLISLLSAESVSVYPSRHSVRPVYQVAVNVIRFDGSLGGDIQLIANWTIFGNNGEKILIKNRSRFESKTGRNSYQALVAAQSRLLSDLSREIADAIVSVHREEQDKSGDA